MSSTSCYLRFRSLLPAAIAILVCGAMFYQSRVLAERHASFVASIRDYEIVFDGRDPAIASAAAFLGSNFGVELHDRAKSDDGNPEPVSSTVAAGPPVLQRTGDSRNVTGRQEILSFVEQMSREGSPFAAGSKSLSLCACIVLTLAVIWPRSGARFHDRAAGVLLVLPILGLFPAIQQIWSLVPAQGRTQQIALAGVLLYAASMLGYSLLGGRKSQLRLRLGTGLALSAVVAGHVFLQRIAPSFCWSCFAIVLLSTIALMAVATSSFFDSALTPIPEARQVRVAFTGILAFLAVVGAGLGPYAPKRSTSQAAAGYVLESDVNEKDIKTFISDYRTSGTAEIVVVSTRFCGAFGKAKVHLQDAGVRFKHLSPCSENDRESCFDGGGKSVISPLVLHVGPDGVIVASRVGWPNDPDDGEQLARNLAGLLAKEVKE